MVKLSVELPENFLEGEERCGFYVTHERKALWAVLLDLYCELARVCGEHGIEFFAGAGTMLGAVRHGGFVPWDDDLDIVMMRDQYELLCAHAGDFAHPYFLQTYATDEGYVTGHAQLRRSDTTGVLEEWLGWRRPFNQGVFIDVFPLDAIEDDEDAASRHALRVMRRKRAAGRLANYGVSYPPGTRSAIARIARPIYRAKSLFVDCKAQSEKVDRESMRLDGQPTRRVAMLSFRPLERRWWMERRHFRDSVTMGFEFVEMPVPAGYEELLAGMYGNWRRFVVGGSVHGGMVVDLDTPYGEWLDCYFRDGARRGAGK